MDHLVVQVEAPCGTRKCISASSKTLASASHDRSSVRARVYTQGQNVLVDGVPVVPRGDEAQRLCTRARPTVTAFFLLRILVD